MCGRFTQYNSREEYLSFLGEEAERNIPYDPEPVGRYNVAPGTRVLLLSEHRSQLHLDPVHWGYAPECGTSPLSSTPEVKLRPAAGCSGHSGSTDGPLSLPTAGSSGNSKTA